MVIYVTVCFIKIAVNLKAFRKNVLPVYRRRRFCECSRERRIK